MQRGQEFVFHFPFKVRRIPRSTEVVVEDFRCPKASDPMQVDSHEDCLSHHGDIRRKDAHLCKGERPEPERDMM
jgi:hypothetical protein